MCRYPPYVEASILQPEDELCSGDRNPNNMKIMFYHLAMFMETREKKNSELNGSKHPPYLICP
jgi:hypothetical protein